MSSYDPFFLFFFSSSYDMFTVNVSLATAEIIRVVLTVICFRSEEPEMRQTRKTLVKDKTLA